MNHLAYAAVKCADQGYVSLGQLFSFCRIGTYSDPQRAALYREAALVQKSPARDALVDNFSQRLVARLSQRYKYIEDVHLDKEDKQMMTTPLILPSTGVPTKVSKITFRPPLPAGPPPLATLATVKKPLRSILKVPTDLKVPIDIPIPICITEEALRAIRQSARFANARGAVGSLPAYTGIKNMDPVGYQQLSQARTATPEPDAWVRKGAKYRMDGERGEDSWNRKTKSDLRKTEKLPLEKGGDAHKMNSKFYEYSGTIVALLELGYLVELEQRVFLRNKTRSSSDEHPDLGRLARELQQNGRKRETFEKLLDDCDLLALGNGIFCDTIFAKKTEQSCLQYGQPQTKNLTLLSNAAGFKRDG
jgi:hypothetical protein